MNDLIGRTVVVTGGGKGIGLTIADGFIAAGSRVVLAVHDGASVPRLQQEFLTAAQDVLVAPCDVSDERSVDRFADLVIDRYGTIDAVIANAGIAGPIGPLHEISPAQWRQCIDIDLTGVYLTFRAFIPAMIAARTGSLIAISSVTGKRPLPNRTPYAAAKMGIIGLVRSLALELGPYGIRANTICPGSVDGPRMDAVFAAAAERSGRTVADVRDEHTRPAALGRLVRADEVTDLCLFLAGDTASAITGEDLNVSAGSVMY